MRKYALVVLNDKDQIINRYDFAYVTNPTGNGFKLNISTITSDLEDIITKVVQNKEPIKFTAYHLGNAYSNADVLTNWVQAYSRPEYRMALEYDDGNLVRYCEGKILSISKTEKDEYRSLPQEIEFKPATPYFFKRDNLIDIQISEEGKSYSFSYPYNYGAYVISNNEITNTYILDIPLIITITGAIDNPTIELLDENGNSYNKVKFTGFSLLDGEQLVINSAQRKIYKIDAYGVQTDYRPNVDPQYDTFLRAKSGTSSISINIADIASGEFSLTGGWRQYTL